MAEENTAVETNNGTNAGNSEPTVQMFTQADVDRIVGQRLARATKDMPTAEELKAYNDWKATQQTEAEKLAEMTKERDNANKSLKAANAKIEQYEREKVLTAKGVSADDLDYYLFKVGQKVNDTVTFEQAADEFLSEHKPNNSVRVSTGASLEGGNTVMTKAQIMQIKDATERQNAIAQNINLFT